MAKITLTPLTEDDREQFILDNQYAFKYGGMEEFGQRDDHFEEEGEIISHKTIEESIDSGVAFKVIDPLIMFGQRGAEKEVCFELFLKKVPSNC